MADKHPVRIDRGGADLEECSKFAERSVRQVFGGRIVCQDGPVFELKALSHPRSAEARQPTDLSRDLLDKFRPSLVFHGIPKHSMCTVVLRRSCSYAA